MLCIHNTQTDPYFNLAAEEYLLKNFKENIFMLWQNEPSIVIGKHQDVWAEVNLKFVQDQQIKIARRFSGGGAVYHDPGNLNLTFIETGQIMQTDKYTIQIMNFLKTLGVHVEVDERKGLTIGGFKISGSAQRRIGPRATIRAIQSRFRGGASPISGVGGTKESRFLPIHRNQQEDNRSRGGDLTKRSGSGFSEVKPFLYRYNRPLRRSCRQTDLRARTIRASRTNDILPRTR